VPRPGNDIGGSPVRRTTLALAVAAFAAATLAGCSDDGGDAADTDVAPPAPPTGGAVPAQSELPNADW